MAPRASQDLLRLHWSLTEALNSALKVAPNAYYEKGDVLEPYAFPSESQRHPVSHQAATIPSSTTTTVRISCIDIWEHTWDDIHTKHANSVGGRFAGDLGVGPYGERYLLECCGIQQPTAKDMQLTMTASGEFLTVHEYVSMAHPWLRGLRERILVAMGRMDGLTQGLPASTTLAVLLPGPGMLFMGREEEWAGNRKSVSAAAEELTPANIDEVSRNVAARFMARAAAARQTRT